MPTFEISTADGEFEVEAPSFAAAVSAVKTGRAEKAGIGYGRAAAQGALIDAPEAFGALVDLLNPYEGIRQRKNETPTDLKGLVLGRRSEPIPSMAERGRKLGEGLIGERRTGSQGEELLSRAIRGGLVSAPFALGGGPLAALATIGGGAAGDVAQGEAADAGMGAVPSAGIGAAVDIVTGLMAKNAPKAMRGLAALRLGAKPALKEMTEAVASVATKDVAEEVLEAVPAMKASATLSLLGQEDAAEFAGRAFSPEPVADYAGKLRVGRFDSLADDLSTNAIRKVLRDTEQQFAGEIDVARRGVRSHEVTEQAALRLGMGVEDLLARRGGQTFNAEELRAADAVMANTAAALSEARDAVLREASEENLARLQTSLSVHAAVQGQVMGATAEAGRALNILKKTTQFRKQGEQVAAIVKSAGGREKLVQIAEGLRLLDTPGQVARFAREAIPATTTEKVIEAWKAALLSNPTTHVVNAVSNSAFNAYNLAEEAVTAGGEAVRLKSTGPLREYAARLHGTRQGMADGFRLMQKALASEMPEEFSKAAETTTRPGAIGGLLGRVVRTPFRALGATDALFRTVAERQELNAQAMRVAFGKGLRGKALSEEAARLALEPTEEMLDAARKQGSRLVFQRELGDTGRQFQRVLRSHPGAQVIVPFFKTPVNLAKEAIARMPLAPASQEFREAMRLGGRLRTEAIAKVGLGSAVTGWAMTEALGGNITGFGPEEPAQRAAWLNENQPYSFKVGDKWVSYQRVEPLATIIGTAADLAELYKSGKANSEQLGEVPGRLALIMAHNLSSKTFLRGVADFGMAVLMPDRWGESWAQSLAGSVIPSGVSQAARVMDPALHETRSLVDAVMNRVPGLREHLPLKINAITGEEITLGGAAGPDIASPFYEKTMGGDTVSQEMVNLRIGVSRPERGDMSDTEYDKFQREAGKAGYERAKKLIGQPYYQHLDNEEKADLLTNAYRQARGSVRKQIRYARVTRK